MMSKKINYLFVGLGNLGKDYERSRHSFGRQVLLSLAAGFDRELVVNEWSVDSKMKGQRAEGRYAGHPFTFFLPESLMNNSGLVLKSLIKQPKILETLVVIHDDIDLPLGKIKISYQRGAGGHRGVGSIIRTLKTNKFIRLRLGISPVTSTGKIKKPSSEKVVDFVIGDFKAKEESEVKKTTKQVAQIIKTLCSEDLFSAMNKYNN